MAQQRMAEAEVSLRLAAHLALTGRAAHPISVAIDGAQVKVGETSHFDVRAFLSTLGWSSFEPSHRWQGTYANSQGNQTIAVHSRPGLGDVCTVLENGRPFVAEAKKGSLTKSRSSAEYPLIREALGQLLTMKEVPDGAVLAVAVPAGERFIKLAELWRQAPLVKRAGILILTVAQSGEVSGW